MLDYSGCWQWFQFLIKYINYEILLQRIASLCPTREWFVLQLTGELYRVHLQLIRKEEEGAGGGYPWLTQGDHLVPKLDGRSCSSQSPKPGGKVSVQYVACVVPPAGEVFVTSWTRACGHCAFNTCSHLKGLPSTTSASTLSISTPSSRKPSVIPSDVQNLNQLH